MSTYNVCDFGATGDGITNDAPAIQQAIDACTSAGGGRVVLPAGKTYYAGRIQLKSNVELHVERGAVLLCSANYDDLRAPDQEESDGLRPFISAHQAENVAITGGGTIDGNGRAYIASKTPYIYRMKQQRPWTMFLIGVRNLTLQDVTIADGAVWTVRLTGCRDVFIHRIRIMNDLMLPNSDAIDLDHCQNVHISDSHIESGDDCIVLKTMRGFEQYGPCENITVSNCTLKSTSSALVIGCEVVNPIRNVIFDSCVISSSHRGMSINLSFESDVENVLFSNIIVETRLFHDDWWGRGEPIYVKAAPWTEQDTSGHIRNVRFQNILCRSENGVVVWGWNQELIDGLLFENVRVKLEKWSRWPGGQFDLRPIPGEMNGYVGGVRQHPTSGFHVENARNVTLRNCEVVWGESISDAYRYALEAHNNEGLVIENFRGQAAHPEQSAAQLIN